MKIVIAVLFFALSLSASAQAAHSVNLTWADSTNPTGTTYNVYRATGLCSGTPAFSKIASAVAAKTYQDSTVTPGNYCYAVTASLFGAESPQSNTVNPSIQPFAPTGLSFTVQ
jgi:hypothetical protein